MVGMGVVHGSGGYFFFFFMAALGATAVVVGSIAGTILCGLVDCILLTGLVDWFC